MEVEFQFLIHFKSKFLGFVDAPVGLFCFQAKDEIHPIYEKLVHSFYYASLTVVWLLEN